MFYPLLRSALFTLDAESAHDKTFAALDLAVKLGVYKVGMPCLPDKPVTVMGLRFPNPVGLAAGLDKNAAHIDGLASFGFGFIEVGTVTPKAQAGNAKPRMFRLPEHEAIINRMGFNNDGLEAYLRNLNNTKWDGIIGVNLGKNKDTPNENAVDDYLIGLRACYDKAHYITINISSPNTQGLRDLQAEAALRALIGPLKREQQIRADKSGRYVPLAVKIAPDLDEAGLIGTVQCLVDLKVDAIISGNTTLSREAVKTHRHGAETGGLSGGPLTELANRALATVVKAADGRCPIIGVGGIMQASDALEKLKLGASLVQVYTGLIYRGPKLVADIVKAI
jgi:dihydroorotate dehydrogenase